LKSLEKILNILEKNNFTVNPLKCEWGVQETDWLGYWLTPHGLKPWKKKVNAILAMKRPTTATQLRSFLGAVNFYRDMYPHRSEILTPLTNMSGKKGIIQWNEQCQHAFETMKALLAKEAFLKYPDHNKPFHIFADASDNQLGAAIFQEKAPVAYYSKKLNAAQRNYTVGEKELLSVVETLKTFRTMLYGSPALHIYTDHRNNTFQKLTTQRVLRWRLFLEDYRVHFHYIKGSSNLLADVLSRLSFDERQNPVVQDINNKSTTTDNDIFATDIFATDDSSTLSEALADPPRTLRQNQKCMHNETYYNEYYSMTVDDNELLDCFVNLPTWENPTFVLDYNAIREAQSGDAQLQALRQKQPHAFGNQLLASNTPIVCYFPAPNAPWKIYLPSSLLDKGVRWYHMVLGHIGQNRLHDSMSLHLYNPDLKTKIERIVATCDQCQRHKNVLKGHGHTAPREASTHPWREVAVDLIGPWQIKIGEHELEFMALTIIDVVTNLVELVRIDNKTAAHVAIQFENTWLARYPRPLFCTYDQGGEFIGFHFQRMLQRHNIHGRPTSSKNPQANAICERMHQTIGNTLRAMINLNPPIGINNAAQMIDAALAKCVFATRAALHSALQASPGSLVFGRDMILDIPVIADWEFIREHRQQLIDQRLIAANRKRFAYDYHIGDEVLKLEYKPNKLSTRAKGPYRIIEVHTNGTITIQLNNNTIERISIRRVKPYHR
jgi:transposase InsO family protein